MLRPSRAAKAKAGAVPPGARSLHDGDIPMAALAADALLGNKRVHTTRDYIWLAVILSSIVAGVVFWPIWDQLIGSEEEDYFSILGVERNADSGVVKRAYRQLAREWHPDHNPGCGAECREKMRTIQEAYRAVSENPDAVPQRDDDGGGFNATLLHLFLGRLFDMVFFFAEFVVCLVPTIGFTQWNGYRGLFLLGGAIAVHLYLTSVRVPLSWVGIAVCLWKFKKLADWAPAIRASQQLGYLFLLVLPASLYYTLSVCRYQGGMSWYQFGLNLAAGIIYLTGFIIRSRAQIFSTFQIKRVPHLPPRAIIALLWDYACTDLLCYTIKIPNPFRIACHVLVLIVLYQRWIYMNVDKTRLNEFGRIIGVQGAEAAQYPGLPPEGLREREQQQQQQEARSHPHPPESSGLPRPQPTEPRKETKEERIARQRQEAPDTSGGLRCLALGIFLLFLAAGLAGFAYQWATAAPAAPSPTPAPDDLPFRPHPPKREKPAPREKAQGQGKPAGASAGKGASRTTKDKAPKEPGKAKTAGKAKATPRTSDNAANPPAA